MLYIGHFSFDEIDTEENVRHGYFACVVKADHEDEAVEKFKEHIMGLRQSEDLLDDVIAIYIEDIIGMKEIPDQAIITHFQSSAGEFPESMSCSLPSVNLPGIEAYGWGPDVEESTDDEEFQETRPFIEFE